MGLEHGTGVVCGLCLGVLPVMRTAKRLINVGIRAIRSDLAAYLLAVGLAFMTFELVVKAITGAWIPLGR